MKKYFLLPALLLTTTMTSAAYSPDETTRQRWLEVAERCRPQLVETIVRPIAVVEAVNDTMAYQHWRYDSVGDPASMLYDRNFKDVKEITLDFGRHMTGWFTFHTKTLTRCQDAPVRIKFFFGEVPAEMNTVLDPWRGSLSRAWMQDETVTVTEIDRAITIPRRVAARYVRIELLGASPDFDFAVDEVSFRATTSASGSLPALPAGISPKMARINEVGVATLSECMQTVFEDGPKRDRRLWAGDLYLQSLSNRYSFRNFDLTKRCLYLFAALADDSGVILSNIFETPEPHPQYGSVCLTYSLLWNSTLLEYLKDTGDIETAQELWPMARRQVEEALTYVGDDGIFHQQKPGNRAWFFFDWRDGLDVNTPLQGAVIFAIDETYELARMLGRHDEVASWPTISRTMKKAARRDLYDRRAGVFVSGQQRQVSALSQAWMIKSGVVDGRDARRAITSAMESDSTVMPGTPYGTHYLVDAMILSGMHDAARAYVEDYWGGMVDRGADTFWESYDPDDDFISAYGFSPVNSACHAWSCTPVYFIARYPEIFAR